MDELWIQEEDLQEALKEHFLPFRIELSGGEPKVYCISVDEKDDRTEEEYLIKFLSATKTFPLYVTYSIEYLILAEYEKELNELGLEYEVRYTTSQRVFYTYRRIRRYYHPASIFVKFMDINTLAKIINANYGIAQMNEFFAISSEDNVRFDHNERVAVIEAKPNAFYITPGFDGHGFYLFSNEERYSSIMKLMDNLPEGTEVTQINDKLIDEI